MIQWIIIGVLLIIISLLLTFLIKYQFESDADYEYIQRQVQQNLDVLELLEIQINEKKEILKELKREIRINENKALHIAFSEVSDENKQQLKTHYTMEEAKNIDWKNVKFK